VIDIFPKKQGLKLFLSLLGMIFNLVANISLKTRIKTFSLHPTCFEDYTRCKNFPENKDYEITLKKMKINFLS
jgi:hypothetical protein